MSKSINVKIKGGMSPTWISTAANSPAVTSWTAREVSQFKKEMEAAADMEARSRNARPYAYYFGSKRLKGKFGDTWLLWPMNLFGTAIKNKMVNKAGSQFKKKGDK